MKLDDLCAQFGSDEFPTSDVREHPERESVRTVREAVTAAVLDDEFLVDCISHELGSLERRTPRRGLTPFYTLSPFGIRFSFGYWPPGKNAGAHEHTAWTITAVCRNHLEVQTFDRDESFRRRTLVPKNRFDASAGRVGFIYEPCIHDPRNPTDRWSLSLHVSSPRDGEKVDQDHCLPVLDEARVLRDVDYDQPDAWVGLERYQHVLVDKIARVAAGTSVAAAEDVLARCRDLGAAPTRRFIDGLGRADGQRPGVGGTLTIVHEQLLLGSRDVDGGVALGVETVDGWAEVLRMTRLGREAMAFCVSRGTFAVDEIPGRLTSRERWAIAEALEESGTFRLEAG